MDRIEMLFAGAILFVVAMGAFAIAYVLRRGSSVLSAARVRQSDAFDRMEKHLEIQKEGLVLMRESIAVQRETNRLLTELLARGGSGREEDAKPPREEG